MPQWYMKKRKYILGTIILQGYTKHKNERVKDEFVAGVGNLPPAPQILVISYKLAYYVLILYLFRVDFVPFVYLLRLLYAWGRGQ